MIRTAPDVRKAIPLDNLGYDLAPPRFAKTERMGGHENITEGLLKTKEDLHLLDALPDPDDERLYRPAEAFLKEHKGDAATLICVRTGVGNTYLSMGIADFCKAIVLEPDFVKEIMWRFSNWTRRIVLNAQELDFDFFWVPDDIGFGNAPMISPDHFREFCVPVMRNVFDVMKLPAVYHSDGNIMPMMEDLIGLGIAGIANFEPGPMDIVEVKKLFGDRITLIGNIDLNYTLTRGTPEETYEEVRQRIEALSPGGRYILSSANSLPNYVKPENVRAMGEALLQYGFYTTHHVSKPAPPASVRPDEKPCPPAAIHRTGDDKTASPTDPLAAVRNAVTACSSAGIGEIKGLVEGAIDAEIDLEKIINEALIPAMDHVGKMFSENRIFVPEMLIAAQTMKTGLNIVKSRIKGGQQNFKGRVLMATVKGDLHDIGKNIVIMMLEGAGFEVLDLGINVDGATLVEKVAEHQPDVLGLSALLTTTMSEMGKAVSLVGAGAKSGGLKIMVGGAPVTEKFALQIGADGYARDAAAAVTLCKKLMGER
jgi:methanogenic corrinoid protein MtbC1